MPTSKSATSDFTVAVVFQHIGPYHHARLNAAAEYMPLVAMEWSAHDSFGWGQTNSPANYRKVSFFAHAHRSSQTTAVLATALAKALDETRPDVVAVNGWGDFGSILTLRSCFRRNIPIVIMSESSARDERRSWLKESVKRRIVGICSSALVGGQSHKDYLVSLGLSSESIWIGYDVVDNAHFSRGAEMAKADAGMQRRRLELPENYFLASSRFIAKKNLLFLVRAYARYRALHCASGNGHAWNLVLLGDGPQRPEIAALARELKLSDAILLPGFKTYEDLPQYYGLANAFVHASTTEQWGLVVNEAMASGLPVIVSDRCGSARELVTHGENGFLFDPGDEPSLADYMLLITSDRQRLIAMSRHSRTKIDDWKPDRFGQGLRAAAEYAMRTGTKSSSWFAGPLLKMLAGPYV